MSLIYSVAFNGYDRLWRDCIGTHSPYAARYGYEYKLVGEGINTRLAMEVAWIKIPLILAALNKGHEWVMFIDSDAAFDPGCPPIESVAQPGKDVYLANGHSGRPNSGVMIFRNASPAHGFVKAVMRMAGRPLPRRHDVGWGENGAVIHLASKSSAVASIDPRWNNNHSPDLESYIYHYSAGPMRKRFQQIHGHTRFDEFTSRSHDVGSGYAPGSPEFMEGLIGLMQDSTAGSSLFDTSEPEALLRQLASHQPSRLQHLLRRVLAAL